jgi:hypothetical protein
MWESWARLNKQTVEDFGWSLDNTRYSHQAVGGLTNLESIMRSAWRKETLDRQREFTPDPLVTGTLRRVIDPTVSGRQVDPPFDKQALQTAGGLLDWRKRSGEVEVPTVFSKTKWVKRRLNEKELASVLDIPADKIESGSRGKLLGKWCTEVRTPFKIRLRAALETLSMIITSDEFVPIRERRRKQDVSSEGVAPRAKRSKTAGTPIDLEATSLSGSGRLDAHIPTARPHVSASKPGAHVRAKDWYVEDLPAELASGENKATKSDNARVPVELWDDRILEPLGEISESSRVEATEGLAKIRRVSLRFWRRKVARDFYKWWSKYKLEQAQAGEPIDMDLLKAGTESLRYAADSSWWSWDQGSAPFFWRWELEFQDDLAKGHVPMFKQRPKPSKGKTRLPADKAMQDKMKTKLMKVIRQKYVDVSDEEIISFIEYFAVPKGDDIRMVYDGTMSGLNDCLFAPWFALPTMTSMFRGLDLDFWCADNDFSDNFLNYWISKELRAYCGIDVDLLMRDDPDYKPTPFTWTRCAMGLKPSPYFAVQQNTRAKRVMLGDPTDPKNVFRWETVVVNLPGNPQYDPSKPRVYKVRADGTIASDIVCYVDDNRVTAPTEEEAWLASSRVAKTASWLGLQDAARKRRPPSQRPGPWAGGVAYVSKTAVTQAVSIPRWRKTKAAVRWLDREWKTAQAEQASGEGDGLMFHKPMESIRGFLNYVTRAYTSLVPYLKGVHLTLDHWRPDRDEDGWRVSNTTDDRLECLSQTEAPSKVKAVSRLRSDIDALLSLTSAELPPEVSVRASRLAMVWYIFGDASGHGLATTAWTESMEDDIEVDVGTWSEETTKLTSSNWKEMNNFVIKLESMVENNQIPEGTELWLFTDNFVTERAYHRGTSSSKTLFALVLRLRKIQMEGKLFIRVVWVAGTRMIEQGADGGSRGDFTTGVLRGDAMLSYVPLHKNAIERSAGLEDWLLSWFLPGNATLLEPKDWFHEGHQTGNSIWIPPPAAADVAVEQLCESRHARPWNSHVFVCPALMTSEWRKMLSKVADLIFVIPTGFSHWPANLHEPLVVALVCPMSRSSPWIQKGCGELVELKSDLSGMWSDDPERSGNRLRQYWTSAPE